MANKLFYSLLDFSGGMNTVDAPSRLANNEFIDCLNIRIDGKGRPVRRGGSTVLYDLSAKAGVGQKLYEYKKRNGTKILLAVIGGNVYKADGSLVQTGGGKPGLFTMLNKCYIKYKNGYAVYDGSSSVVVTPYAPQLGERANLLSDSTCGIMSCDKVEVFDGRVWFAGSTEYPDRLYLSYPGKPEYFTDYIDFTMQNGVFIKAIKSFRDALCVITDGGVFGVFKSDGAFPYSVVKMADVGADFDAVEIYNNMLIYVNKDGVNALKNVSYVKEYTNVVNLSFKVKPTLTTQLSTVSEVGLCAKGDYLYLTLPEQNIIWVYDGRWVKDSGIPLIYLMRNSEGKLLGLGFSGSYKKIYEYESDSLTDDGVFITYSFTPKDFDFGAPANKKRLRRVYWLVGGNVDSNIMVTETTDGGVQLQSLLLDKKNTYSEFVLGETVLGDATYQVLEQKMSGEVSKKTLLVRIGINHVAENPITVMGIIFQYKIKKL